MKRIFTMLVSLLLTYCFSNAQSLTGEANPAPCKEYQYVVTGLPFGTPGNFFLESGLGNADGFLQPISMTTVKVTFRPYTSGFKGKLTFSYMDKNGAQQKISKDLQLGKSIGQIASITNDYTNNTSRSITVDACYRGIITFTVPVPENADKFEWSTTTGWQQSNTTTAQMTYLVTNGNGGTVKVRAVNTRCQGDNNANSQEVTVNIARSGGATISTDAPASIAPGAALTVTAQVNASTSSYTWQADDPAIQLNGQSGTVVTSSNYVTVTNTVPAGTFTNRNKFFLKVTASSSCGTVATEKKIIYNVPVGALIKFQPNKRAVKLNEAFWGDFGYDHLDYLEEGSSDDILQLEWQYSGTDLTMSDRDGQPLDFIPYGASAVTLKKFTNNKVSFNVRAKNALGWSNWQTITLLNEAVLGGLPPEAELIHFQLHNTSTKANINQWADFGYHQLLYLDRDQATGGILEMDWQFNQAELSITDRGDNPLNFVTKSAVVVKVKQFTNGIVTFQVRARNSAGWSAWRTMQIFEGPVARFNAAMARQAVAYTSPLKKGDVKVTTPSSAPAVALQLYPNPVTNTLQVQLKGKQGNAALLTELYDLRGTLVLRKADTGTQTSLDVSRLAPGNYTLRVIVAGQVYTKQVIKVQ